MQPPVSIDGWLHYFAPYAGDGGLRHPHVTLLAARSSTLWRAAPCRFKNTYSNVLLATLKAL